MSGGGADTWSLVDEGGAAMEPRDAVGAAATIFIAVSAATAIGAPLCCGHSAGQWRSLGGPVGVKWMSPSRQAEVLGHHVLCLLHLVFSCYACSRIFLGGQDDSSFGSFAFNESELVTDAIAGSPAWIHEGSCRELLAVPAALYARALLEEARCTSLRSLFLLAVTVGVVCVMCAGSQPQVGAALLVTALLCFIKASAHCCLATFHVRGAASGLQYLLTHAVATMGLGCTLAYLSSMESDSDLLKWAAMAVLALGMLREQLYAGALLKMSMERAAARSAVGIVRAREGTATKLKSKPGKFSPAVLELEPGAPVHIEGGSEVADKKGQLWIGVRAGMGATVRPPSPPPTRTLNSKRFSSEPGVLRKSG